MIALICLLLPGLVCCTQPRAALPSAAPRATPSVQADATLGHVSISVSMTQAEKQKNDALYDYFSRKFNVDLVPRSMSYGDHMEKTRVWMLTGDMPDLMWMDINEGSYAEYASWAREGRFRALPDNLSGSYPHIAANFNRTVVDADDLLRVDGTLYAYPSVASGVGENDVSPAGFYYRKDWAEKLGMSRPGDVYTWDEMIALDRAMIVKDPGRNGPGKTVGIGTRDQLFPLALGINQTISVSSISQFEKYAGQYEWTATRQDTLTGLLRAKELFDEGLIWNGNALGESYENKYEAGLMGIAFDYFDYTRVTSMRRALKQTFLDIDSQKALSPMFVIGPDGTYWAQETASFWGAVTFSIGMDDEKMDRVLKMFDWLLTDEGRLFGLYGLKGKDYRLTQDGAECLWQKDSIMDGLTDPYPSGCRQFYSYAGLNLWDSPAIAETTKGDVNRSKAFHLRYAFIRKSDLFSSFYSSPARDALGDLAEQTRGKMVELLVSSPRGEVQQRWQDWVASKMPAVQPVLNELNRLNRTTQPPRPPT